MKHFNLKRFGRVLSYTFLTLRRNLLSGMVGMLLCYLFIFVVSNMNCHASLPETKYIVDQALGMSVMATFIFIAVATGTLFRPEESRQGRTSLMMLPASNLEKFLARWVWLWALILAGCLMFVVADGLHAAYHWLQGNDVHFAVSYISSALSSDGLRFADAHAEAMWRMHNVDIWLMFIALHAFYLFGSTLVRRFAFLWTSGALALMGFVWVWLIENEFNSWDEERFLWFIFVLAIVGIVLFTWLAYRSFCRWQLITRKYLSV